MRRYPTDKRGWPLLYLHPAQEAFMGSELRAAGFTTQVVEAIPDETLEQIAAAHQRRMRVLQWSIGGPIVASIVIILALWWSAKPAHAEPFYCKTLAALPRSCASVKATAKTFGSARAERMARRCGASDAEIAEAKACK